MITLFGLFPVYNSVALVDAQLYVAAVPETADLMVPFGTPLRIKYSFSLWYFVITVLCYDNIYLLLCLLVDLLFHLLSTFYMMVGSLNLNIFYCMVSAWYLTWKVSMDQVLKASLESGVFILLTAFFFWCSLVASHVSVPHQIQDVQLGQPLSALVSRHFFSLWKHILL